MKSRPRKGSVFGSWVLILASYWYLFYSQGCNRRPVQDPDAPPA